MDKITILTSVLNALDTITVQGYENHYKIIGSMNDIRRVINELENEEHVENKSDVIEA